MRDRKVSVCSYDEIINMDDDSFKRIKYLIVYITTEMCDGTLKQYIETKNN